MIKSIFIKSSLIVCLTLMAYLVLAQSGIKTDKVTIFTDANSYVQKSGTILTKNGLFELSGDELPAARFGTLGISDFDKTILSITSSVKTNESEKKTVNFSNVQELLSHNKGIKLKIQTASEAISGELIEVLPDYIGVRGDKLVMLKTADIQSYSFDSEPVFKKNIDQTETKAHLGITGYDYYKNINLTIHFSSVGEKKLNINYIQKGLSWSPMYTLRLLNEKKAELSLQAEIVNDAEDLNGIDIDLVLGKPNFKFEMYLTDLLDYNHILNPFYETQNSNYSDRQYLTNYSVPLISRDESMSGQQKTENDEQQLDFYFHRLHDITLKKNNRGLFKIFNKEITYRHIYECDLVEWDYQNINYNRNYKGPDNIVYHSVLIDNNSDILFGKGSILIIKGSKETEFPLAQSILEYIPPKSEGLIKLTENHEIEINHTEQIVSRSTNKIEFWGRNYYTTIIEGSIKVKNLKSEGIEILIRSIINGELIDKGTKGEIVFQNQPIYSPNYLSKIKWNLNLKAGEELEIKYQYKVLVN